ncbi:hypothetical protein [Sphingomonas sp. Leaf198]|uniref:hypothetical protein n=1 Tax=Sphingomonas sp. Leaf198 TaxID=1736299 RepID=UPI0006F84841|nr:hypothetical protein [Sphingomonas sp. Leaf198]KQS49497.1 hypothetical protein ASG20_10885 [Sphingomonas sp. Leaf198]
MLTDISRALALITDCSDPEKLKKMAANARRLGETDIERAASLKLYSVMPSAEPGTLEHDVWRSIYALEGALKDERGKTTMLGRTRQKVARDGEAKTVADLVRGTPSDGFRMLMERDMEDHTFEAVALRHRNRFDDDILAAASARLGSPDGAASPGIAPTHE